MYYRYGYVEVPPPQEINCGCDKSNVTEISGMDFNQATGEFKLSFVQNGETKTMTVNVAPQNGVTDIHSMVLETGDILNLTFMKNGEAKTVKVNLNKLEDDIFIEDIQDNDEEIK